MNKRAACVAERDRRQLPGLNSRAARLWQWINVYEADGVVLRSATIIYGQTPVRYRNRFPPGNPPSVGTCLPIHHQASFSSDFETSSAADGITSNNGNIVPSVRHSDFPQVIIARLLHQAEGIVPLVRGVGRISVEHVGSIVKIPTVGQTVASIATDS